MENKDNILVIPFPERKAWLKPSLMQFVNFLDPQTQDDPPPDAWS